MTTILIIVLFVLQLFSFYWIIILNTKVAKFKDLEIKQAQLMREMDDAISVYLAEMKDENDRLIKELQIVPKPKMDSIAKPDEKGSEMLKQAIENDSENVPDIEIEPRIMVPKKKAVTAYSRQQQAHSHTANQSSSVDLITETPLEKRKEMTIEEQVVYLSNQGKTVEEIAKQLQKGKTEIELLLKFHY